MELTKATSVSRNSIEKEEHPGLLQRSNSYLLQHAVKLTGLRRQITTKVPNTTTLPQIQPRQSNSSKISLSRSLKKPTGHHKHSDSNDSSISPLSSSATATTVFPSPPEKNPTPNSKTRPLSSVSAQQDSQKILVDSLHHNENPTRIISTIPEDQQQSVFTLLTPQAPSYYRAFLSSVASEFKRKIIASNRIKNDIEYSNCFDGKEAVDELKEIIGTGDRMLALRVGRALEFQRFFHDVNYEKRLVDDIMEIYQFNELLFSTNLYCHDSAYASSASSESSTSATKFTSAVLSHDYTSDADEGFEEDMSSTASITVKPLVKKDHMSQQPQSKPHPIQEPNQKQQQLEKVALLPTGIYTNLTFCYSPTCNSLSPCYSYTCPKRERLRKRPHSVDTREKRVTAYVYEVEKEQQLWSQVVDDYIVFSTPSKERKRQETIFELIYTEQNFSKDLDYIVAKWIEPLQQQDIIPQHRRNEFVSEVFSNIMEIRTISQGLTTALKTRQEKHPIISNVSDIMGNYVMLFEPFVHYGARQLQAKHTYEHERISNPKFALFAEKTERDVSSRKLELNGYLTKPTTRLGRYTLLLGKICSHTADNHPDKENIPRIISEIKVLLQRVNNAAGAAKTRFDLEQIHRHLTFKNKNDKMDLKLLEEGRSIIKQGTLRKTGNMGSTEYHIILFDHYLVITKIKRIEAAEYYYVQNRPIPIELLGVTIPPDEVFSQRRCSNTLLLSSPNSPTSEKSSNPHFTYKLNGSLNQSSTALLDAKSGIPITLFHQGSRSEYSYTLYAASEPNCKSWCDAVRKQREIKLKRQPVFEIMDAVKRYEFFTNTRVHHMITFDDGNHYMLATDSGLYTGLNGFNSVPRKILSLEKVQQVHIIEEYQLLLVLSGSVLWHYPLHIVMEGGPDGYSSIQKFGRKIRTNVPFFYVGTCLDQTLICVPKPSSVNGTEIDLFKPSLPKTEIKKKTLLKRLSARSSNANGFLFVDTQVTHLKPIYSPCDVWAIDTTHSMMLLTTPLGIIGVDMKTKKADRLLDPSDKDLMFVTNTEQLNTQLAINQVIKLISVFQVPDGDYLVCYNKYAFYIDRKGRRAQHKFKIEWEGHPTAFAYHYPYIIAFEQQFIEIRSIIDGHLEQVIQEESFSCLQNGHKSKEKSIFGTMLDSTDRRYQNIFKLELIKQS